TVLKRGVSAGRVVIESSRCASVWHVVVHDRAKRERIATAMGDERDDTADDGGYRDPRPGLERRVLDKRTQAELRLARISTEDRAAWPRDLSERFDAERARAFMEGSSFEMLVQVDRSLDDLLELIDEAAEATKPRSTPDDGGSPAEEEVPKRFL